MKPMLAMLALLMLALCVAIFASDEQNSHETLRDRTVVADQLIKDTPLPPPVIGGEPEIVPSRSHRGIMSEPTKD